MIDHSHRSQAHHSGRQMGQEMEALVEENRRLRQELFQLRQQLAMLGAPIAEGWTTPETPGPRAPDPDSSADGAPAEWPGRSDITAARLRQWSDALARHPRWGEIRIGVSSWSDGLPSGGGLKALIEDLMAHDADANEQSHWQRQRRVKGYPPQAPPERMPAPHPLEEELERRHPGLGTALRWALKGPQGKGKVAVRAAFALYGERATELLTEDPMRVVEDLLQGIQRVEGPARQAHRERVAREAREAREARDAREARQSARERGDRRASAEDRPAGEGGRHGQRASALDVLGLEWDASREAIRAAHRRLVKQHHPDMGGEAEAFHRINMAYQTLIA